MLGVLAIHAELRGAARSVRLNLSDHRQVTSPTLFVPSQLGGPARIYYQAVRGPTPIPVSLTEIDGHGRTIGSMRSPRVLECPSQLIHFKPVALLRTRAPGGETLSVTYQPYRALGASGYGLEVELLGRGRRVLGSGALRIALPLEWDVRRMCGAQRSLLVYGILPSQQDSVLVRAGGVHRLNTVTVPAAVRPHSTLVYGFEKASLTELIVRKPDGETVADRDVASVVAETPCS